MKTLYAILLVTAAPASALADTTLGDLQHDWSVSIKRWRPKKRTASVPLARKPTMPVRHKKTLTRHF